MSPRPCVAMKAISAGVAFSAAIVRSPSFSRSSSSQTTTIRPARNSSSASSMVANGSGKPVLARSARPLLDESLHVFGDHVYFDVDGITNLLESKGGELSRVGNEGDAERRGVAVHHGKAYAVDGY